MSARRYGDLDLLIRATAFEALAECPSVAGNTSAPAARHDLVGRGSRVAHALPADEVEKVLILQM
jgi:hypothetical protein